MTMTQTGPIIPIFTPDLGPAERQYLMEAIDSGWISSQGAFISRFEEAFAARAGMPFGVATSNCTTALHLALDALGIGAGDEVLCPDLTFIAPANMIELTGATPVLVDVEPLSWCIDPRLMEAKITPRTKAVIVVHAFGHAADMDPIMAIAARHGLKVIEDVAEAPDALYKNRTVGGIGDLSCYSFFANKIMTTGEGGIVLARSPELAEALRIRRDHGMSRQRKYLHVARGYNYRMTNLQAAIGLAQLERLESIHVQRNRQAEWYQSHLADDPRLTWRPVMNWCNPVHWLATISLRQAALRDPLLSHLQTVGIDCRQMIYPVHAAEHFAGKYDLAELAVSTDVSYRSLHLPSSTTLRQDEIAMICGHVQDWVAKHDR